MSMIFTILIQATVLLSLFLLASCACRRNVAQAHQIIVCGLVGIVLLPCFSIAANKLNIGVFQKQTKITESAIDPSNTTQLQIPRTAGEPSYSRFEISDRFANSRPPSHQLDTLDDNSTIAASPAVTTPPAHSAPLSSALTGISWGKLALFVWIALSLIAAVRLVVGFVKSARIVGLGVPLAPELDARIQPILEQAKGNLGIESQIDLRLSTSVTCPVIWNWFSPAIILPIDSRAKDIDWLSVLTHELAHRKRCDHWVSVLAETTKCLVPWHPLIHFATRELNRLSEFACDGLATRDSDSPEAFAESLLAFVPTARRPALSAMSAHRSNLARRVTRLLEGEAQQRRTGTASTVILMLCSAFGLCSTAISQTAESPPKQQKQQETQSDKVKLAKTEKGGATTAKQDPSLPAFPAANATDEAWGAYLKALPKNIDWRIANKVKAGLRDMKADRSWRILKKNWEEIEPRVSGRLLSSLNLTAWQDGKAHPNFFDMVGLAFQSKDKDLRHVASMLMESTAFKKIRTADEFERWRKEIGNKSQSDLLKERAKMLTKRFEECDEIEADSVIRAVHKVVYRNKVAAKSFEEVGFVDQLETKILEGELNLSMFARQLFHEFEIEPQLVQVAVKSAVKKFVDRWERAMAQDHSKVDLDIFTHAMPIGESKNPAAIPSMIGIIEADNSYGTVYGVGYFGLGKITGVKYSATHDGAWWRRWWEENKSKYPLEIQQMEIPSLTKSKNGKNYKPFPSTLDTLDGVLEWMLDNHKDENIVRLSLDLIEDNYEDPKAIPVLIGILDCDNSTKRIWQVGRCLKKITGQEYSLVADGSWWRAWWNENKIDFPQFIQSIPIPNLEQTEFGKTYQPFPVLLTLDDKIEFLKTDPPPKAYKRVINSMSNLDKKPPEHIPLYIGIIDADNSYSTVYGVGYFCLGKVTGVGYSPSHDGAWWKRWWDENKSEFPIAQHVPIPELPKTAHGKTYEPLPEGSDTVDGLIAMLNQLGPDDHKQRKQIFNILSSHDVKDDTDIPKLIGIIDSDNSSQTVYNVAAFAFREVIGSEIRHSPIHDGQWWRRWWKRNMHRFSKEAQQTAIPKIQKSANGLKYRPFPAKLDSLEGKIEWVEAGCPGPHVAVYHIGQALLEHEDSRVLPILIGWIKAENSTEILRMAESDLHSLTGIRYSYSKEQSVQWWLQWWETNKSRFPKAAKIKVPDMSRIVAKHKSRQKKHEQEQQQAAKSGL